MPNPIGMQFIQAEITPVILFSGNFRYNLADSELGETAAAVGRVLTNWQTDLSTYCKLITDRFLSPSTPTLSVPTVADRDEDNLEPVEIPYAPNLYPTLSFS